jgi:hypothetical protein
LILSCKEGDINLKRNVFILLTHTGSVLTNIIKKYTKAPYNHTSIAFDIELRELYSFGRLHPNNPFIAGFVKEDIRSGTFAKFEETIFSLYSFEVSEETYQKMIEVIKEFEREKEKFKYNLLGLIGVMANRPIKRRNAYFCSQFVATVFERCGIEFFDKPASLVRPDDFIKSGKLKFLYHGKLKNYNSKIALARLNQPISVSSFNYHESPTHMLVGSENH